jgi:hypothetical protein
MFRSLVCARPRKEGIASRDDDGSDAVSVPKLIDERPLEPLILNHVVRERFRRGNSWKIAIIHETPYFTIDHNSPRARRRRDVGVKPENFDRCNSISLGAIERFRCRSIRSATSSRVIRQTRPTRYPDSSPRFKRRESQRTPSAMSGRINSATSASEYVLNSASLPSIAQVWLARCLEVPYAVRPHHQSLRTERRPTTVAPVCGRPGGTEPSCKTWPQRQRC